MRRGPGLAGLQNAARAREQYKATGDEVRQSNLQAMKEQMARFKASLEEFAQKHRKDIRSDPVFRAQFQTMCANIGVDPLASNKGMWAQLLGFGDFYYELGVQVVEACWATRSHNGGLLDLGSLLKYVNKRRGSHAEPISEDDVVRAIKKLKALGNGFDIVLVGKQQYVRSVPGELNLDGNAIISLAQERGFLSASDVQQKTGWDKSRTNTALQGLLRDGLAMIDDGPQGVSPPPERLYWFPCTSSVQA